MSYLIKDTTREQRAQIVKQALAISISGTDIPTDNALAIAKEYIDGKIELKEAHKKIISMYKRS